MRTALVNPRWSFEGSISFGCRDPHLPLEHGYTKALLGRAVTRCCCSMLISWTSALTRCGRSCGHSAPT